MKPTLVLIHGWGVSGYNHLLLHLSQDASSSWKNRPELISLLNQNFHLSYFNLPGFYGTPEPKVSYYQMEDFVEHFSSWLKSKQIKPDYILGVSFGGALALNYKIISRSKVKLILVSPALMRSNSIKSILANKIKTIIPETVSKVLKPIYQKIFSKYYRQGTSFIRNSYDHIARLDSRPLLKHISPNELLLIYGDCDTATPASLVQNYSSHKVHLVPGGGHEIGSTHPQEIIDEINSYFTSSKNTPTATSIVANH